MTRGRQSPAARMIRNRLRACSRSRKSTTMTEFSARPITRAAQSGWINYWSFCRRHRRRKIGSIRWVMIWLSRWISDRLNLTWVLLLAAQEVMGCKLRQGGLARSSSSTCKTGKDSKLIKQPHQRRRTSRVDFITSTSRWCTWTSRRSEAPSWQKKNKPKLQKLISKIVCQRYEIETGTASNTKSQIRCSTSKTLWGSWSRMIREGTIQQKISISSWYREWWSTTSTLLQFASSFLKSTTFNRKCAKMRSNPKSWSRRLPLTQWTTIERWKARKKRSSSFNLWGKTLM